MATKKERRRQLAREAHQRRMQRRIERERRQKQIAVAAIVAVLVVAVGLGTAAAAGAFSKSKAAASAGATVSPGPVITPSSIPSASSTAAMVNGECVYTYSGTAARLVKLPPAKPDLKATYTATIATNRGDIKIDLLNSKAPCTVNNFVSLAEQKFYNSTPCHRLTTSGIFVLQCGDPTGTGNGGPGYVFNSENLKGATYPAGTVAMANTGQPDSNGSQFFLVYKNGSQLSPDYTPFGTIVSGLNIIQKVAKAGSTNSNGPGDGKPKEPVEINSVTIKKT